MTDRHDPVEEDLAELRSLASRLSLSEPDWEQPPVGLWDRIAAEAAPDAETEGEAAPVASIAPRPKRSWVLGAVAAAVVFIVGAVVLVNRPASSPPVLATADLARLDRPGSGGGAELVEVDGELRLRVDTVDLDSGDGFLELWMINTDVTRLVSLGPIRADGDYDLPQGLDPEKFPVVDVSIEPLDGDPTHSGDSVLRGQLAF